MYSGEAKSAWFEKGVTLSDKPARKEFGLTQEEITVATTLRRKKLNNEGQWNERKEN